MLIDKIKKHKDSFVFARYYRKIDYVMRILIGFQIFLFVIIIGFAIAINFLSNDIKETIATIVLYIIFAIFMVPVVSFGISRMFVYIRKKAMQSFSVQSFNQYMDEVNNISPKAKKPSEVRFFEIFIYSMWEYVEADTRLKQTLFMDEIEKDNIDEIAHVKLIIVSLLRCLTYTRDGRVYRIPSIYRDSSKLYEIINAYKEIYEKQQKNNISKSIMLEDLKNVENKYLDSKKLAKEKWSVLSNSGGGLKEVFSSTINNEEQLLFTKKICAVVGLILLILDICIDISEWDKNIAIVFEIITVYLLFVDISKDKDFNYLH